jgi:hypothetical protein
MRWETVSVSLSYEVYELWNNNQKLLTLTYHPGTHSARVESAHEKRVLLIRKEGFRKNKTVLRTEYGIFIGQIRSENKEPILELGNERFFYSIQNPSEPELVIYKESKLHPVAACKLNTPKGNASAVIHSNLLLAFCWYLLHPAIKERIAEFAA